MRILLSLTFAASAACNPVTEGGSMRSQPTLEEDLRAIEALNQHDVEAVRSGDTAALITQWTEDLVAIPPAGAILRGRESYATVAEQSRDQMKAMEVLDNVVEFEEVNVLGNYAYAWGTYRGSMRPRSGGETTSYGGRLMRILQRQPDGTWKMHRAIWTNDPPSP
jgi:uncharacterized protein (TIGR02246 family)